MAIDADKWSNDLDTAERPNWHDDAFFGIHYDLHAKSQDTELGRELSAEHLIERLQRVQPDWIQCDCKGHAGYTSWPTKIGYTSPGVVQDSMRIHREATRQLGIPLGMHYSGVWDTVAIEKHPEWGRINDQGVPDTLGDGSPDSTCRLSGYDRELMIPQMLELVDEYDVDGFWVDGENWAARPCWCDRCQAAYRDAYGDREIPRSPDDPGWADWLAFHRQLFVDHVRGYADAIHARKPSCTIVSNWMYTMRQPDAVEAPVDYFSGDFDWRWGADRAAVEGRLLDGRGRSWDLMAWGFTKSGPIPDTAPWVMKSATQLSQETAEVVALGGAVMIYDTPQRSGWLTGWHQDTLAEVAHFCRARKETCFHSVSRSEIAILHPKDHYYTVAGPLFEQRNANYAIEGALHALLELQYSADILTDDAVQRRGLDQYRMIVVPERTQLGDETYAALDVFANRGGHVLLTGPTAAVDFPDLVGAVVDGPVITDPVYLAAANRAVGVDGPWQPVTPKVGTESWGHALRQQELGKDETDQVIVTHHPHGEGSVTVVHGPFFEQYHNEHPPMARRFLDELIDRLNISWEVVVDGPPALEVTVRTQDDQLAINLINRGAGETLSPRRVMFDDLTPIANVCIKVSRQEAPHSIRLEPSDDPVPWAYLNGTLDITVPVVRIHDIVVIA
ncbi:MAG: alpha-L-fucosidase [Thermomicrobiales bacterium]